MEVLVKKIKSPGGAPAPRHWCTTPPLVLVSPYFYDLEVFLGVVVFSLVLELLVSSADCVSVFGPRWWFLCAN
jgi:hypothetical protein